MNKKVIIGWTVSLTGMLVWLYGYFVIGNPSLINWHAITPLWAADFLPNFESEVGTMLMIIGMVPIYWPSGRFGRSSLLSELLETKPNRDDLD
jgi:hypothetical protein